MKIYFRVTPATRVRLHEIAKLNGLKLTDFVKDAVDEAVADCSDEDIFSD